MRPDPVTLRVYLDQNFQAHGYGFFDDEETRESDESFVKFVFEAGVLRVEPVKGALAFAGPIIDRIEIFGLPINVGYRFAVEENGEKSEIYSFSQGNKWIIKKPNLTCTDISWRLRVLEDSANVLAIE